MPDAVCLGSEEAELLMPLLSAAVVGIFGTFEINISFNTRQCAFLLFPVCLFGSEAEIYSEEAGLRVVVVGGQHGSTWLAFSIWEFDNALLPCGQMSCGSTI